VKILFLFDRQTFPVLIKVIPVDIKQTKIYYKVSLISHRMTFKTAFMGKFINKYLEFSEKLLNQ